LSVGGGGISNLACIRDYIFLNHADHPSVNHTGVDSRSDRPAVYVRGALQVL